MCWQWISSRGHLRLRFGLRRTRPPRLAVWTRWVTAYSPNVVHAMGHSNLRSSVALPPVLRHQRNALLKCTRGADGYTPEKEGFFGVAGPGRKRKNRAVPVFRTTRASLRLVLARQPRVQASCIGSSRVQCSDALQPSVFTVDQ